MATGAAVAAVTVGTVLTVEGQKRAARARAEAARANAEANRLAALELLDRFEINTQALKVEGELLKGQQKVSLAGKGIEVGAGSALDVVEETNAQILRQIRLDRREAEFKAAQLRAGADIDERLAGDLLRASRLQRAGSFLRGGAQAATLLA